MALRSKEYWLARSIQREREAYLRGVDLSQRLFSEYDRSAKALRKSIQAFYGKYATEHGLDYEDTMKVLTRREAQEWKVSLAEYVAQINVAADPKAAAELTAQLDALSVNSQISRLEALLGETQAQMDVLYDRCLSEMRQEFGEVYAESYYHKHFDLQSRAGWIDEIAKLTPGMIEDAVSYPWSGAMFSDRLWQNKSALLFNMREAITQSLIQGKGLPETSKALAAKMGQSYKVAERLVRTETNHLHNQADLDTYAAAGIEEYEFMATLDARTCEECGALDGEHFKIKDATPGTNFPPMHPNDRCTTVEYDPEDAADWAQFGEKMPTDMTYEQWKEKQLALESKSGIMKPEGDNVGLDIEIDRFTPCLFDRETGENVDTEYKLATPQEIVGLKKEGWLFNWRHKDLKNSEIYKLMLADDDKIQGLVAIERRQNDSAYYLKLAESAPCNKGANKCYEGVGGHLFAIAAQRSFEDGFGGFIFFEAKNVELVQHYQDKFGAFLIGRPHEYSMIIDEDAAQRLLKAYTLGEESKL